MSAALAVTIRIIPEPIPSASTTTSSHPDWRRHAAACLILLALVLVSYWGVWSLEFTSFDDQSYVLENPHVKGWSADHARWALTSFEHAIWSPLVWMSFMLDYEISPNDPSICHVQNLVWHAGTTLLLFLVLYGMTGSRWRSATVATVFGVHPVHVESVAWIAERKDVLSAACFVLALAAYLFYVRRPSLLRWAAVAAAMILGLASKPSVVTLPFVLLLLDYWPLGRLRSRADLKLRLLEKAPLLAISFLASLLTSAAARDTLVPLSSLGLGTRIANAAISYLRYLGMFFWPVDLAVYYPYPEPAVLRSPAPVMAGLAMVAVTAGVVYLRHRRPYFVTGWFWYVGVLVPMIGLVRFGDIARADRFMHLPSIGLAIIVVWGLGDLFARWAVRQTVVAAVAGAWILSLVLATQLQVAYWSDSVTLYRRAIAVTGGAYLPHYNLGRALAVEGKLEEATHQFESALRFNPNDPSTHTNLGLCLARLGRNDEALASLTEAVTLDPSSISAINGRGILYASAGEFEKAESEFKRTLELNPDFSDARYNLALVYLRSGRRDDARAVLEEMMRRGQATADTLRLLRSLAQS